MAETSDPVRVQRRVEEAMAILKDLGLPKAQQNERSGLALLALLDLTPDQPWSEAKAVLRGITQLMEFMADQYGKRYAPNTRETVRRQSVHQLRDAGIALVNPDDPQRPINSGKTVYQIAPDALALVHTYGTLEYERSLQAYILSADTLVRKYAQERQMQRIPVRLTSGEAFTVTAHLTHR